MYEIIANWMKSAIVARWRHAKDSGRRAMPFLRWAALWGILAIVIAGTAYLLPLGDPSDRIRVSGMLLQFVGLATVVVGLSESRKLFKRTPIRHAVWQWIIDLRYVVVPRKPVVYEINVSDTASVSFSASAHLRVIRANPTIEERVAALANAVSEVEARQQEADRQIQSLREHADQNFDKERRERDERDSAITKQLEEAVIGGIHLELAGLLYLFVGIMLATIPEEAATMLRWGGF
jgi:hypothetical protein